VSGLLARSGWLKFLAEVLERVQGGDLVIRFIYESR
jgi:hypothetical protein